MTEEVDIIRALHRAYLAKCPYEPYRRAIERLNDAQSSGDGGRIIDALSVIEEFRSKNERRTPTT
jgi:hypothetical protein